MQQGSVDSANYIVECLSSLDGISSKKMFGGHGIFCNDKMFGMVNSKGQDYLKADESNKSFFEENGSVKHGKMPYYSIPDEVFDNTNELLIWAQKSVDIIG